MLSSVAAYGERYQGDLDTALSLTMSRSARRGPWLPEEDQALLQLVRTQGANNWVRISQQIQHRSPKQCRERYHQNLKPSLKHDPISAQEGEVIERLVQEMGKRWAEIARRLGNRSDNAVKNWWNGSVNRRRRNPTQPAGFKQVGNRLQPIAFTLSPEHKYTQTSGSVYQPGPRTELSYDLREEVTKNGRAPSTQIPTPAHTRTSSMTGTSTLLPFDPVTMASVQRIPPATSATSSRPILSKVNISDFCAELPPIRSSSFHLPSSERRISGIEHGPISPALSDTSQKHVPSLMSDSQSMYSVSPRTVTTPRPNTLAPMESRTNWSDASLKPHDRPSYQVDIYVRDTPYIAINTVIQRHHATPDDRYKDSRMNVSTLLQ